MKKLSVLIALVLCVTIGGVYAAWNYAQGNTASVEITREINMAQVNTNSNKGTISATPRDVAFLVDDSGEVDGEGKKTYKAVLTGTGSFTINFTPAQGADESTITNGIKMLAKIEVKRAENVPADADKYQGVVPLTTNTATNPDTENPYNIIELNNGNPTKSATIEVTDILKAVTLADVKLPSKAANDAFHSVLKYYTIVITISEVVA